MRQALQVLPQDNISLKYLLQATGDVNTSDVDLAVASKAIIFGFNVRASGSVKSYANNRSVEIWLYKVIYELIDDVRNAMEGLLDTVEVNHVPRFILGFCLNVFIFMYNYFKRLTMHSSIKIVVRVFRFNMIYLLHFP